MRNGFLVPLLTITLLALSCHKDHPSPTHPATPTAPKLATTPASNITSTTATSGGTFVSDGTDTINFKGIQWDTSSAFSNHWTISAGSGISNFSENMTGLFPNTLYYIRAFAGTDSSHIYYGDTIQFTTTYTPGKYLVSTLAGTGAAGLTNGDASIATFNGPFGVTVDAYGNIFVADAGNKAIRKITPAGVVSTLALTGGGTPEDIVADAAGNVYVPESNCIIQKITPSGQISTFAGSGTQGRADGTGTSASFNNPVTIAIDPAGNLYVGDILNFRKITPGGVVTTLPTYSTSTSQPCFAIAVDSHYNLYESDGHAIVKVDSAGAESFVAGSGQTGNADGTGLAASFGMLTELRIDAAGNIYAADISNNKVRLITPASVATTTAGTGVKGAQDGNSAIATFNGPIGLAFDNAGNIIVVDAGNNKIRKITLQ